MRLLSKWRITVGSVRKLLHIYKVAAKLLTSVLDSLYPLRDWSLLMVGWDRRENGCVIMGDQGWVEKKLNGSGGWVKIC